jgi:hypothetical protein
MTYCLLAVLAAGEEDPLDGLSPAQIVLFCEKYGIDPTDPLEVSWPVYAPATPVLQVHSM